jgi:hypothetical protein
MDDLRLSQLKRKHAQKDFLFVTPNGCVRISAPGRGGWRRPTALELALGVRSLRKASRFQEGD